MLHEGPTDMELSARRVVRVGVLPVEGEASSRDDGSFRSQPNPSNDRCFGPDRLPLVNWMQPRVFTLTTGARSMRPQMATTETRQYRGYKIVPMRQWASWCAEAFPTRADLPFLTQFPLRTLAPSKEAAMAEVKQSIDRILASVERRH